MAVTAVPRQGRNQELGTTFGFPPWVAGIQVLLVIIHWHPRHISKHLDCKWCIQDSNWHSHWGCWHDKWVSFLKHLEHVQVLFEYCYLGIGIELGSILSVTNSILCSISRETFANYQEGTFGKLKHQVKDTDAGFTSD